MSRVQSQSIRVGAFAAIAAAFLLLAAFGARSAGSFEVPWWSFAVVFAASEVLMTRFALGRRSFAVGVTEVAFVAGLLISAPLDLLQAYLVGVGAVMIVRHRYPLIEQATEPDVPIRAQSARRVMDRGRLKALRSAIENEDLSIYLQPKVRTSDGSVQGVEALVRWEDSSYGQVGPKGFIPLAEETGLIAPLTISVLQMALEHHAGLREIDPELHMAVNLSMRSLSDVDICNRIGILLDRYEVSAERLELEITESSIMDDPVRSIGVLGELHAMGIKLAIDDFGTGYSSLSYLRRLPLDLLKIDRSFVMNIATDPNDAVIVRSIVDLGRHLGLSVVAEGVENQRTFETLGALGCETAQGYFVSPPLPPKAFNIWLAERTAHFQGKLRTIPLFPAATGR